MRNSRLVQTAARVPDRVPLRRQFLPAAAGGRDGWISANATRMMPRRGKRPEHTARAGLIIAFAAFI